MEAAGLVCGPTALQDVDVIPPSLDDIYAHSPSGPPGSLPHQHGRNLAGKRSRRRWETAGCSPPTLLMASLALALTFLGSAPTGSVGVRALDVVIVSLSSLTIFLAPLIASSSRMTPSSVRWSVGR